MRERDSIATDSGAGRERLMPYAHGYNLTDTTPCDDLLTLKTAHHYIILCYVTCMHMCQQFSTSSRRAWTCSAHSVICFLAHWAAPRCGHSLMRESHESSFTFSLWISSASLLSVTSSGYNFVTGLFVIPLFVRMFAERTSPSLPVTTLSITAIFQFIRGQSSWISATSPTLTCWPLPLLEER